MNSRRTQFAQRFSNPLLQLLILDWRFACILPLVVLLALGGFLATARIWRTTSPGVLPIVQVSLVERIQSRNLALSASQCEAAGDLESALISWRKAIETNPGSVRAVRGYVNELLLSPNSADWPRAFQAASWLTNLAPKSVPDLLLWGKAATKNEAWDSIEKTISSRLEMRNEEGKRYWLQAQFFSHHFNSAAALINSMSATEKEQNSVLADALRMISGNKAQQEESNRALQRRMLDSKERIPAHEAFLVAAEALKKTDAYGTALKSLSSFTTDTLKFQCTYARLLMNSGRREEAISIAEKLPAPQSSVELIQSAALLFDVGMATEAVEELRRKAAGFPDLQPAILYATLLFQQGNRAELESLRDRMHLQRNTPENSIFSLALAAALDPQKLRCERLASDFIDATDLQIPLLTDLACTILLNGKQPVLACKVLLKHPRLNDPSYARELFYAADAARDSSLMRKTAAQWHQWAPEDLSATLNYTAMLAMFDEEPALSLALAERCIAAAPKATAARLNQIAALANTGKFKLAEALTSSMDEDGLNAYEKTHFNFLKLKNAMNSGHPVETNILSQNILADDLYPVQLEWLEKHGIKLPAKTETNL